jgi:hypothetical protein
MGRTRHQHARTGRRARGRCASSTQRPRRLLSDCQLGTAVAAPATSAASPGGWSPTPAEVSGKRRGCRRPTRAGPGEAQLTAALLRVEGLTERFEAAVALEDAELAFRAATTSAWRRTCSWAACRASPAPSPGAGCAATPRMSWTDAGCRSRRTSGSRTHRAAAAGRDRPRARGRPQGADPRRSHELAVRGRRRAAARPGRGASRGRDGGCHDHAPDERDLSARRHRRRTA